MSFFNILLVGAGGALGSMARYATVFAVDRRLNSIVPYGTLTVNVLGSFALGFLLALFARKTGAPADAWRFFLAIGFCGGFTTFSAFAAENAALFVQKFPVTALLYVGVSLVGGLLAVWAGLALGKQIL